MKFFRRKYVWAIIFGIILVAFTGYTLMDTFVIERVYTVVPVSDSESSAESTNSAEGANNAEAASSAEETGNTESTSNTEGASNTESTSNTEGASSAESSSSTEDAGTAENALVVSSEDSYSDENISITITAYREYNSTIYVADVKVSSAEYLRTAFANSSFGKNITEKTSEIAEDNNAILAINGDFYGSQNDGYVIRNGQLYRDTASSGTEALVINDDGSFSIVNEGEVSAEALLDSGANQVLSFGPALVTNHEVSVSENEEVGKAKASNPRTAIGIVDDLHYLFVVSDGRTSESQGLTLYQLADFISGLGAEIAYNLDGGGSSTMYFNGQVVNNPTTNGKSIKERSVSDIVYIG